MMMTSNYTTHHHLWVHVPKHEEDEEFSASSSFTLAKKNMMMTSNYIVRRHLSAPTLDHGDNNKQCNYLLSSLGAYSET